MRILYIGVYRDGTGWSNMAINTMMALIRAGADVVARPVKLNTYKAGDNFPPEILAAEHKSGGRFDVVIQNVLPHMFDYSGRIPLNIGYYCTETSRFDGTNWPAYINTMDMAWVCNSQSLRASRISGVNIPLKVVPIACDIQKYQRKYKELSIRNRLGDDFIFYYIGDFNKRKNIPAIIKAFHLEFDVDEPVSLVIKTNIPGNNNNIKTKENVVSEINRIKHEMKIYPSLDHYKQEIILVGHYTDEEIMRLHASCDCFVCPSYGEAYSLIAFDAMAMGKTPIVTDHTGFLEYMTMKTGWLVDYTDEPVWGMSKGALPTMFTSREMWGAVSIYDLRTCMREAYKNRDLRQKKGIEGRKRAYDFTYEKIGKRMIECLSQNVIG